MKKKVIKIASLLLMAVVLVCARQVYVNAGTITASSESERLITGDIGRYVLNYTGNTNHVDWWDKQTENKNVSRNFKDRTDIESENNSTGRLTAGASDARIARAYLYS